MSDPTPKDMLQLYRRNLTEDGMEFNAEQVAQFKSMSVKDQCELLFHMIFATNGTLQYLHSLVEPDVAKTRDIDDFSSGTH